MSNMYMYTFNTCFSEMGQGEGRTETLGLVRSKRTTVTLTVGTVDVAATRRISIPEDCTQRAFDSKVGAPDSNVTVLSRDAEPRRPRMVTSECLAPVSLDVG